jgi:hypothetical protein
VESFHAWAATIFGFIGCLITVIIFTISIIRHRNAADAAIRKEMNELKDGLENQINAARKEIETSKEDSNQRIWKRIDEIKENHKAEMDKLRSYITEHYVDEKYCTIVHQGTERAIREMKNDHDKNISEIKDSLKTLGEKLDKLVEQRAGN